MVQKVQIHLIDDLTGEEAQETVRFGLDGSNYEIDLTADNAAKLREALGIYTDKGRKTQGKTAGRTPRASSNHREDVRKIRRWARENGHTVSERGRISAEILDAYNAARPTED